MNKKTKKRIIYAACDLLERQHYKYSCDALAVVTTFESPILCEYREFYDKTRSRPHWATLSYGPAHAKDTSRRILMLLTFLEVGEI